MSTSDETFEDFLRRREKVSTDYINGRFEPLQAISATRDPATFFPPSGKTARGADAVNTANAQGASSFAQGSTGHFDIWQANADGELGFWTGLQYAQAMLNGKPDPVPMQLRITEIFRRENGEWKLVHRHADELKE